MIAESLQIQEPSSSSPLIDKLVRLVKENPLKAQKELLGLRDDTYLMLEVQPTGPLRVFFGPGIGRVEENKSIDYPEELQTEEGKAGLEQRIADYRERAFALDSIRAGKPASPLTETKSPGEIVLQELERRASVLQAYDQATKLEADIDNLGRVIAFQSGKPSFERLRDNLGAVLTREQPIDLSELVREELSNIIKRKEELAALIEKVHAKEWEISDDTQVRIKRIQEQQGGDVSLDETNFGVVREEEGIIERIALGLWLKRTGKLPSEFIGLTDSGLYLSASTCNTIDPFLRILNVPDMKEVESGEEPNDSSTMRYVTLLRINLGGLGTESKTKRGYLRFFYPIDEHLRAEAMKTYLEWVKRLRRNDLLSLVDSTFRRANFFHPRAQVLMGVNVASDILINHPFAKPT